MKHGHWQLIWILILTASLAGIGAGVLLMSDDEVQKKHENVDIDDPNLIS